MVLYQCVVLLLLSVGALAKPFCTGIYRNSPLCRSWYGDVPKQTAPPTGGFYAEQWGTGSGRNIFDGESRIAEVLFEGKRSDHSMFGVDTSLPAKITPTDLSQNPSVPDLFREWKDGQFIRTVDRLQYQKEQADLYEDPFLNWDESLNDAASAPVDPFIF